MKCENSGCFDMSVRRLHSCGGRTQGVNRKVNSNDVKKINSLGAQGKTGGLFTLCIHKVLVAECAARTMPPAHEIRPRALRVPPCGTPSARTAAHFSAAAAAPLHSTGLAILTEPEEWKACVLLHALTCGWASSFEMDRCSSCVHGLNLV
jgi:hypothetical protein